MNELGEEFMKERTVLTLYCKLVIQEINRELERLEDTEIKGPPRSGY